MDLVVDASVALSWVLLDESNVDADRVQQAVTGGRVIVPSLWGLEVCNALVVAQRRGRITASNAARSLQLLEALPIEMEEIPVARLPHLSEVAHRYGLSAYDASYLVVAMRRGLPLATLDRRVRQAAGAAGIGLVP